MTKIYFDQLLDWVRGYAPRCHCGERLGSPARIADPQRQGRECYRAMCSNAHVVTVEAVARESAEAAKA